MPFLAGVSLLWLLFWAGFITWWWLMSFLFQRGDYALAVAVAYGLPVSYTLAAFIASKVEGYYIKLLHFATFFVLSLVFALGLAAGGAAFPRDAGAYIGMALIALVMAIMQYPKAGLRRYETYKTSLFIGGVIFMPLFIYFAALLPNVPHTPALDKVWLFPVGMLGFWLSGAWLAFRGSQGVYVPGLEIKPLMPFRPDFILPGGVTFVKGLIMMGVGLMIAIHPALGMPRWNWWGFVLAFWGIITLIPLRGMYKMVKGKRARMLGMDGMGFTPELYKGLILFVGLNILLYGFVNAFFGTTPFLELGVKREFNSLLLGNLAGGVAVAAFLLSFAVLVLWRGWYKTRLLEGAESWGQMVNKQLLLYLGSLLLLVAYIHLLNLPPIRQAGYMAFYPGANPLGFAVGLVLFLAGSALILVLRPIALRNEFEAMVATMVGVISDSGERMRRWVMENRVRALTSMAVAQRDQQVKLMMAGLGRLPQEKREAMMKTQIDILSELPASGRRRMMASMDKATLGGV
ncbi:MAG: hypothetical protein ACE5IA_01530 [Dehalococcoidia bacterium]